MIKIFGQMRYHWQPELSILIIYWSLSLAPIFIGLILMYESSDVPILVLSSFFLFMLLLAAGGHRYFTIYENGILRINTANPFKTSKIEIASIQQVEVNKTSLTLIYGSGNKKRTFYMRKWPKHYFINALAINPYFKGQVDFAEKFINVDYFEMYYGSKKNN